MYAKLFRPHHYFSIPVSVIISILLLSLIIPRHNAKNDSKLYKACRDMNTSLCGKPIKGRPDYPFWGENIRPRDCGLEGFELSCENGELVVDIAADIKYRVVEINPLTSVLQLNPYDHPLEYICDSSSTIKETILDEKLFHYGPNTEDLHLFYHCSDETQTTWIESNFTCPNDQKNQVYFFHENSLPQALKDLSSCTHTRLPVSITVLEDFIRKPIQPKQLFEGSFEPLRFTIIIE